MPKKKDTRSSEDTFLPDPGQASNDPDDNFVIGCFVELLRACYGLVMSVAVPAWALVRFMCWEMWQSPAPKK